MSRLYEYYTTGNNSVWRRMRKMYLAKRMSICCGYCRYHKGENKKIHRPRDSWKKLRNNQYRPAITQ